MRLGALVVAIVVAAGACGGGTKPEPAKKDDAGTPADAATLEVAARPLGMPDLASFQWRKRAGHPTFRAARKAEGAGQWDEVVKLCRQVLAADPGHLEAAYLLAAALGKLGQHDALLAPLHQAAAGDLGKWGFASLELPALQAFLATPIGQAWRARVEQDRAIYAGSLTRAVIVNAGRDLYAYDLETKRWFRITRTFGTVIGALRVGPNKLAFVSRQRGAKDQKITLAIGLADLARGKTSRAVELGTRGPITIAVPPDGNGVFIGEGSPKSKSWRRFDDDYRLTALPATTKRPKGPWLEVNGSSVRLHALPVAGVVADWDDAGLASAIRLARSSRVVSVPAPGLIDGNTATWSPDRARLAFVAQLDEKCTPDTPNAAIFVADATTGALTEIERGRDGLAVEWVDDHTLAVVGDKGVTLLDLDGAPPTVLEGADGLIAPRHRATCTPVEPTEPPAPEPDSAEATPGETVDAGVVEPPLPVKP